jgi:hypothetical protein
MNDRLAWFLFLRMDNVEVGALTPEKIAEFLDEFGKLSEEKVEQLLREEYRYADLPAVMKGK